MESDTCVARNNGFRNTREEKPRIRPEFIQRILQRCAGDDDPMRSGNGAELLGEFDGRVLDAMAFVQHLGGETRANV